MSNKVETFYDSFDDNSLDTGKWTKFEGGSAVLSEVRKRIEIAFPASSTSSTDGDITSVSSYDLTNSKMFLRIVQTPLSTTHAEGLFRIYIDSSNWFQWIYDGTQLYAQRRIAGSTTTVTQITFTLSENTWWQIREEDGDIIWETSPDGKDWFEEARYTYSIAITAMKVMIAGICFQNETNPGFFIVDNFNYYPSISEKSYIYKISRDGNFLGVVDNVITPFRYSLNINSPGTAINCMVGLDPDIQRNSVDTLITESGDDLITESGDTITTERPLPMFGNDYEESLIRNGNDVEVYEVSPEYPAGEKVFSGYISRWKAKFGDDGLLAFTVVSYGVQLDNRIIQTGRTQQAQMPLKTNTLTGLYWSDVYDQQFTPTSAFDLSQVELWLRVTSAFPTTVTIQLCQGNPDNDQLNVIGGFGDITFGPGNAVIATSAPVTVSNTVAASKLFTFDTPVALSAGVSYYLMMFFNQGEQGYLEFTTAALADLPLGYAPIGNLYYGRASINNASFAVDYSTANPALYCTLYSAGGSVVSDYTDQDPTDIFDSVVTDFNARGGNLDVGETDDTGLLRTYGFSLATTLEGIKKALELAPPTWFWRVDVAFNDIDFLETNTEGDHLMILGRHIDSLELEANIENLKNVVYFSGGDAGGGINLFIKDQDDDSLDQFPQGLARISDNRVTLSATAGAITDNFLGNNADEVYVTQMVIPSTVYDISLFRPGDTVAFAGFGSFIDDLVLQIASITRESDQITLNLGVLPKRATAQIETALHQITDIQTVDNPDTPS